MKVMHVHRIFHNIVSKFVGLPINYTWLYASDGHPDTEAAGMVVAAIVGFFQFALAVICPAKLAAPNY